MGIGKLSVPHILVIFPLSAGHPLKGKDTFLGFGILQKTKASP